MLTVGKGRAGIPVEESFAAWREDPGYVAAYEALEGVPMTAAPFAADAAMARP